MLGIQEEEDQHDAVIIMFINSAISTLSQMGMTSADKFTIEDDGATWEELLDGEFDLEFIKPYIFIKTKLVFDPPAHSFVINAYQDQLKELESRINIQVDRLINTDNEESEDDL